MNHGVRWVLWKSICRQTGMWLRGVLQIIFVLVTVELHFTWNYTVMRNRAWKMWNMHCIYEPYCGCKYEDASWLWMRFVDPHGRNTNDFVTGMRWYLMWDLRCSQWSSGMWCWVVAWVVSSPCLQGLLTHEGKGTMVLQNVWSHLPNTTVSDPRRPELSWLFVYLFCRVKAWGLAVCA